MKFRLALAAAVGVALAALFVAAQATKRHAEAAKSLPWALAQQRDQTHLFTVEAYGFAYRGRSGNLIDEEVLLFGAFEKERLFFMRDYLARVSDASGQPVVIDVGANTGHHSLFLSRIVRQVHAFEPFPPVIQRFKQNLALNPHVGNLVLHEVGLGAAEAELPFSAPTDDNHGVGTFRTDSEFSSGLRQFDKPLRIVVGDTWLAGTELSGLALIKIDVEGFEEPVLQGLAATISRYRPLVVVEVSPPSLGGTVSTLDELAAMFPERYEFLAFAPRSLDGAIKGAYVLRTLEARDIGTGRQIEVVAFPAEQSTLVPRRLAP